MATSEHSIKRRTFRVRAPTVNTIQSPFLPEFKALDPQSINMSCCQSS